MADYHTAAMRAAKNAGVDYDLFSRLINQESRWNPNAVSPVGAFGLTQIMPDTAKDPGFGVAPLSNRRDTDDQLRFGAEYLKAMLDRYDGDQERALAAYNWGAGNADKWSGDLADLPAETRGYIANIMNGSDASPTGRTGTTIMAGIPHPDDYEEDEDPREADYAGLMGAGLNAMETGDLSGLATALMAAQPSEGGLFGDAMTNWQDNQAALGGLLGGFGGLFNG